ncbi:uncharacterized protein LOC117102208 [Anneissia japonica]|uniref:uncharacterized protein LOC117102208 n=1 Tax=Anneissia japonica TaxID=1529436 RepID=UPI00142553DD|nr:uncharacterized protein LOC117102208 [Anneissia japonica]
MAESGVEVIYQGPLKKGTPLDENGKAKKSFLKRSSGWKDRYFLLYLKEDEEQNSYAFLACHEKKPQNNTDEPKGLLKLWPHYRVDKKFDPKGKQHIFEVKTPETTYRLMAESQATMDLWVFHLQIQTKLRHDFPGDTFEVRPADSDEMRRIGAKSSYCLVNISKWGITLALKKTKSVISQWPLKCVRGFESSDDGKFKFDAGRNSPMGQGKYLFNTKPGEDNKMFDLLDEYTTAAAQAEKIASPQNGPPQPPSDEEVATQYQSLRLATFGLLPQRKISGPAVATSCISIPGSQKMNYDRLQRKQSYGPENEVPVISRNSSAHRMSGHRNLSEPIEGTPPPLPPPRDGSLPHDEIQIPSKVVRPKDFRRFKSEPGHMYEPEPHELSSPLKDYPDAIIRGRPSSNHIEMNHYQTPPPVHYMSPRNSIFSQRSSITSDHSSVFSDRRESFPMQGAVGGHLAYTTMGMPRSVSASSMKAYYEAMAIAKNAAILQQVSTPSPYENALTGSYENAPLISPGFYFSPAHPHSNQGFLLSPVSPQFMGVIPVAVPKEEHEDDLKGAVGGVPVSESPIPKSLSETQFTAFSKERLKRQVSVPYASVNRDKKTDAELGYLDMKVGMQSMAIKRSPSLDALLDTISTSSSWQDESALIGSLDLANSCSPVASIGTPSWVGSRKLPLPPELLDGHPNAYTEMDRSTVKKIVSSNGKATGKNKAVSSRLSSLAYEDIEDFKKLRPQKTFTVYSSNPTTYEDIENLQLKTDESGYLYSDFQRDSNLKKMKRTQSNPDLLKAAPQDDYCEVLNTAAPAKGIAVTQDKKNLKKSRSIPNLFGNFTQKTSFAIGVKPASHFSTPGNSIATNFQKKKSDKKPEKKPKPKKLTPIEKNIVSARSSVEIAAGISTSSKTKSFSKHGGLRNMQRSVSLTSTGEDQGVNQANTNSTAILSNRPLPGTPNSNPQESGSAIQTRPLPHLPGNTLQPDDQDWV